MSRLPVNNDAHTIKCQGKYFCWLSGWTESCPPQGYYGPWKLQIAHLASGGGRATRVNDRRAVCLLAPIPHLVHVSDADRLPEMTINGAVYPTIDERHTLYIKQVFDRDYFDLDFLRKIWVGIPPEPIRPPQFWVNEMFRNSGLIV